MFKFIKKIIESSRKKRCEKRGREYSKKMDAKMYAEIERAKKENRKKAEITLRMSRSKL